LSGLGLTITNARDVGEAATTCASRLLGRRRRRGKTTRWAPRGIDRSV